MRPDQASTFIAQIEFAFARYGDRVAFVEDDGRRVTYAAAYDQIRRLIAVFAELGLKKGTGVACLAANSSAMYLSDLAIAALGGRYAGLHPLAAAEEHAAICDDCEASILLIDPHLRDHASMVISRMQNAPVVASLGPSSDSIDVLAKADRAVRVPTIVGASGALQDDLLRIFYTGGTTGRSKGAEFTHRAVAHMSLNAARAWQMPEVPRYLATGPITHGSFLMLMPTLLSGGTIIFHKGFQPDRWLRAIAAEQANFAFVVPTMIYAALDSKVLSEVDLSSLQTVAYGGSPMSPSRLAEGIQRFGKVFNQFYGQTECLGQATSLWREEHDPERLPHLLQSCGLPMPGVTVNILDDEDRPVAIGQPGEVVVRSAMTMRGYWKQPELTETTLRNGWLHTGDIARRDDKGYFYIVDRKKDMIISGGFNVYPKEIEDILTAHPAVALASVIGIPHERWGEQVTAVVVRRHGIEVSETDLQAFVKNKKGAVYAPKAVIFADDLPRTAVGKIDKQKLRRAYWTDNDRNVN
jgi:fatty-acyl-CoA synthase